MEMNNSSFALEKLCTDMDLEVIYAQRDSFELTDYGINRPGLQLHGYFEYFDEHRIQVVGKLETSYLLGLNEDLRRKRIDQFFAYEFPCLIIAWNLPYEELFLEAAKKHNRIVLRSREKTTKLFFRLVDYIDRQTAPMESIHGVLVEIHGVGVLITGASGIGKSETALELIKRGNTLISDDVVEVRNYRDRTLEGTAPDMLRYYMEVRGIGIINVRTLFGARSVKEAITVDMVIRLENWDEHSPYDRLGLDEEVQEILGVDVPLVTIPVSSGRNLAVIIETAAINNRMKALGYHSAKIFCDTIEQNNLRAYEEKQRQEKADSDIL